MWDAGLLSGVSSRDIAVRELSLQGYPIFCAAVGLPSSGNMLVAGGGNSAVSFLGTLIHSVRFPPEG